MAELRSRIASLAQALKILEIVIAKSPAGVTLKEISMESGLHYSTVYRYLSTFEFFGYVRQRLKGVYIPGTKLLEAGFKALASFDLREVAHPILVKLVSKIGQTVHMAVREGMEAIYIDKVEGPETLQMRSRIGMKIPLYCTALGKVLLAFSNDEDIENYLNTVELQPRTLYTIVHPHKLREELRKVKEKGYAIDNQENEQGIMCIGVPVVDFTGKVVAAVSASGFFGDFSEENIQKMLPHLQEATRLISKELGCFRQHD